MLDNGAFERIYGEEQRHEIEKRINISGPLIERTDPPDWQPYRKILETADVIVSGWGGPTIDETLVRAAPRLKIVFYGAGSIRRIMTDAAWDAGVRITSSYAANAVPVAEYTLSQIIFCLKRGWQHAVMVKKTRNWRWDTERVVPGAYGSTVGIVSLGMIGRNVCRLLGNLDVDIIAYDPYADERTADELGVQLVSLDTVFELADVVSLHTPWLPETERMIRGRHFELMKRNAAFINTARGAVVAEDEMVRALQDRTDITAVLDVTYPEPPDPDGPLFDMKNVVLTPHIAGSVHNECRRMGRYMIEEIDRYMAGEPLKWEITREQAATLA